MRSLPVSDRHGMRRWARTEIVAAVVLAAIGLVSTASLPSYQVLGMILAVGGLVAVITSRDTPVASLLIVALLALSSAPTVEIASVNIRVEQPAVLFLACHALFMKRDLVTRLLRRYWFLIMGLIIWLCSAAASSVLEAPDPVASLRIVAWLGISMTAGGVAAVLAARAERYELVIGAIVLAAAAQVAVAVLAATSGRVFGVNWGGYTQVGGDFGFRATGLAWEANIFASGTAIAVPLAMARYIGSTRRADLALIGLLGIGVWVALTRTVFVTLGLGVTLYLGLLIWRERAAASRWLPRFGAGALALVLGLGSGMLISLAASSSTPGILAVRNPGSDVAVLPVPTGGSPRPSDGPGSSPPGSQSGPPGSQSGPPGSQSSPLRSPSSPLRSPSSPLGSPSSSLGSTPTTGGPQLILPIDIGDASTFEFRLVRLRESFGDLRESPWIGLGANSFGQRHADPSQSFRQDYLAMLPFTILYDAGLVGLAGFVLFLTGTVIVLLRWRVYAGSAAFAASIAIMLASYVTTDALRFTWNWLVIGSALGLAYRWRAGMLPSNDVSGEEAR